ncbi:hypothetical protein [Sandaracinus amylolyticus]|uniref:Uncharacterized protein n=1 Tax=Sandaracinus amylolyticus TaxID=927083 RepID=A0A0F6W034_9BACT|nr:hypothetical protein [Sandaracinus amylolyticus]AKF03833.1 hypothetical protein DB32_000982 [Sandaracinus amylolyticus]
MKRRTLARRIAARRRLVEMAFDYAPFFDRARLERVLRERAPGLVLLVGEREMRAVLELASRPLRGGLLGRAANG